MSMLSRLVLLSCALALSAAPAHAGFGATASVSSLSDGTAWAPSLDFRKGPVLIQVHALDLIGALPNDTLNFGLDGAYLVKKAEAGADVEGVIMVGGGFRVQSNFDFDPVYFNVVGKTRFGAEMKKGAGIGLYAVPTLGISNFNRTEGVGITYGGGIELSAWLK